VRCAGESISTGPASERFSARQIDLDQTRPGGDYVFLPLEAKRLSFAGQLVRGDQELDDRDDTVAGPCIYDFDITLRRGLAIDMDENRLRSRDGPTVRRLTAPGLFPGVLHHVDIGTNGVMLALIRFDEYSLFDSGSQLTGQCRANLIAGIRNQRVMDVMPVLVQIWVHAGKRAFHRRISFFVGNRDFIRQLYRAHLETGMPTGYPLLLAAVRCVHAGRGQIAQLNTAAGINGHLRRIADACVYHGNEDQ
jgi:hypothetical protein